MMLAMQRVRISDIALGGLALLVVITGVMLFYGGVNRFASGITIAGLLVLVIVIDVLKDVYGTILAVLACLLVLLLSGAFIAIGLVTAWPFGQFTYTGLLGWEIQGLVPWTIPVFWLLLSIVSFAHTEPVALPEKKPYASLFSWAFDAALLATFIDAVFEPVFAFMGFKVFQISQGFQGIPLQHYLGFFMITFLLQALLLAVLKRNPVPANSMRSFTVTMLLLLVLAMLVSLKNGLAFSFGLGLVLALWLVWKQREYAKKTIVVPV